MEYSFDEIQKWLKWLYSLKIFDFIKEIWNFFFHSNIFWKHYNSSSTKNKVLQTTTYVVMFIMIVFLCIPNVQIKESIKVLLTELLGIFPFVLCVLLSTVFALCGSSPKDFIGRILILGVYSYCLFIPLQILFLILFNHSENYLFYAVACLISIIAELYIVIIPCSIFIKTKKGKFIYVITILCAFTLLDFSMDKLGFVSQNKNFTDIITQERFELGKSIRNAYTIPTHVISHNAQVLFYLYGSPIDSVCNHKYSEADYFAELKSDIDSLLQIIPRTKYKTNRDIFNSMYVVKKKINSIHNDKSYLSNPIITRDSIKYGTGIITGLEIREYSPECLRMNSEILNSDIQNSTTFENVQKVWYLRCIYRPYILFKLIRNNISE